MAMAEVGHVYGYDKNAKVAQKEKNLLAGHFGILSIIVVLSLSQIVSQLFWAIFKATV